MARDGKELKCRKCGAKVELEPLPRGRRPLVGNRLIVDKICSEIRAMVPTRVAAMRAGIDRTTLWRWMERGRAQKRGQYRDFCNQIELAEADRRASFALHIAKAGTGTDKKPGDWRALIALSERIDAGEFGVKINLRVEEELTSGIERLAQEFAGEPEIFERACRALAGEVGRATGGGAGGDEEGSGRGSPAPAGAAQPSPGTG